jgi:hypothetical protein
MNAGSMAPAACGGTTAGAVGTAIFLELSCDTTLEKIYEDW